LVVLQGFCPGQFDCFSVKVRINVVKKV
jgi:hypothetical protein